jgi:hypothetical protein
MAAVPSAVVVLPPGALAACPHGGQTPTIVSEKNVMASGQPLVTSVLPVAIAGCSFTLPSGNPHPCTFVSGVQLSGRIVVNGRPALLSPNPMLCKAADQAPQGVPLLLKVAAKVVGT